jgi:hypothetical protein
LNNNILFYKRTFLVLFDINRERCGEKSLLLLEDSVQNKGFDYACVDDPDELILIMCGNQWDARECQIARQVLRQAWNKKLHGTSDSKKNSFSLFVVFYLFLCKISF